MHVPLYHGILDYERRVRYFKKTDGFVTKNDKQMIHSMINNKQRTNKKMDQIHFYAFSTLHKQKKVPTLSVVVAHTTTNLG